MSQSQKPPLAPHFEAAGNSDDALVMHFFGDCREAGRPLEVAPSETDKVPTNKTPQKTGDWPFLRDFGIT